MIPFYAVKLGLSDAAVTFVTMGVFALVQFISAPIVGRLSDRYGRKPILAITMIGSALSYAMLIVADTTEMLVFARAFGGLNAGNLAIAFAYVADITTEDNRARGLGLLGAAFGLGFVFGPVIGGFLAGDSYETANYVLPAVVSTVLSLIAALGVIFLLKESLSKELREELKNRPPLPLKEKLQIAFGRQTLALLVMIGFLFVTSWSLFEVIYPLWGDRVMHFGPRDVAWTLGYVGVVSAIIQGGAIGPLTTKFGEHNLLVSAIVLVCVGFVTLANASTIITMGLALTLLSGGSALFNPSISSLVSKSAEASEQGSVLGVYQGAGALARIAGPSIAGWIMGEYGAQIPYMVAAFILVPTLIMIFWIIQRRRIAAQT